jgi:hypothetical protein
MESRMVQPTAAGRTVASRSAADVVAGFTRGGLWVAIGVMATWNTLVSLPFVVLAWASYGFGASGIVFWAGFAVIGAVSAVALLRGGWRRPVWPWTACALLLVGALGNELTMHGGFFGINSFGFTAGGWFALVVLWHRPFAELLWYFAGNAVVGLAALLALHQADRGHLGMFVVDCIGASVFQVAIYAGSRAVAEVAGRAAEAADAAASARNARLAAEAVQAARRVRYEEIRSAVAPLLGGLADGSLDLAAQQSRQQIAVAVTRLRRFLAESDDVPDPLSHELRACADAAERRGVAVDLIAAAGTIPMLAVGVRRALIEPVIQVLGAAASRARITVVALESQVTVAIVADTAARVPAVSDPGTESGRLVEWDWDQGGDRLWAQAKWTEPSVSLS